LALIVAVMVYAAFPRHPDLRAFDQGGLAQAETAMWRAYYDKRYLSLFAGLYGVARSQYGFSPFDSVMIALDAARAARAFQPSRSRAEANAALPMLVDYFGRLSAAAPVRFDDEAAAAAELDWWQARREAVGPDEYGLTIARVACMIHGVDNEAIRTSGVLRARAMEYRDRKADGIGEADWAAINNQLLAAYRLLKQAVGP
jgi:hypothetical protein